jgi:hypothetical protein
LSESKKRIAVSTPKGVAKYPWLSKACTTFDPKGVYKTGLLLRSDSPECLSLKAQIDVWLEESLQEAVAKATEAMKTALANGKGADAAKKKAEISQIVKADPPYALDLDKNSGEETGYTEFKFKRDAQRITKEGKIIPQVVLLFDAAGKPLTNDISIYGGSIIKVNFTPWNKYMPATKKCYVTLQLNAVQVIELVSGGLGTTASDFGFETEEGYICEQPAETEGQNESIPPNITPDF